MYHDTAVCISSSRLFEQVSSTVWIYILCNHLPGDRHLSHLLFGYYNTAMNICVSFYETNVFISQVYI